MPSVDSRVCRNTSTAAPTAAVYTAAKTQKQLRCTSTGEGIKKIWSTYTMGFTEPQKNEIMALTGKWMQLEIR